jgi:LPPG:FO 2-phospho-L-lactate transferase
MTDDPVATKVDTPAGRLDFQDYFVGRRQSDDVLGVVFEGAETARLPEGVAAALAAAEVVVVCPSNPIVSVGPILALPGLRGVVETGAAPVVAVSPIVGGRALKGPADRMLATLGHEVSAAGVAALYAGLVDGLAIDVQDRELTSRIESYGMRVLVTPTIMGGAEDRRRLAEEVLSFGRDLAPERARRRLGTEPGTGGGSR